MSVQEVILVDEEDRPIGFEAKLTAHQNGGKLHRAFSVFITNSDGQMLLQRRSRKKYHFGGLWTNACCSHPRREESLTQGARARLRDEFGIDTPISKLFCFVYRADDPSSGLTEHEYDHVFHGRFDGTPKPNPEEIDEWRWMDLDALKEDLERSPDEYTPWFKLAIERVCTSLAELA